MPSIKSNALIKTNTKNHNSFVKFKIHEFKLYVLLMCVVECVDVNHVHYKILSTFP